MLQKKRLLSLILLVAACCLTACAQKNTPMPAETPVTLSRPYDVLLVNGEHPLPEGFSPGELVNCYEEKRHFLLANSSIELAREAFEAANRMFKAAEDEDMNGFILTSGYRSPQRQAELYAETEDGTAQAPGCSEHETGLAFDVTARSDTGAFEHTPQVAWLYAHCWDFGFILRYPEGKEQVTGIAYEPWHYRYVGEEIAGILRQTGWTLEEFCLRSDQE